MADTFTPAARELIAKKVLAHVASLDPDGSPNVSPVWTELDGDNLVITTSLGRAKARNLATDPRVAVSMVDPESDERIITLRGSVVGFTTIGADDVSDRLAMKYTGVESIPKLEGEIRVIVRIQPDRISNQPE